MRNASRNCAGAYAIWKDSRSTRRPRASLETGFVAHFAHDVQLDRPAGKYLYARSGVDSFLTGAVLLRNP
jgi:hypothetical protein